QSGAATIDGSSTGQTVKVDAGSSGSYELKLVVTNTQTHNSTTCTKTVTINPLPTCSITGSNAVCKSSTGNTYSGPAGPNRSYAWQISGNGSINGASNAQSVNVNAGNSGSFTLTLTVTDTQTGCSSVCTKTVTVNPLPTCSITGHSSVCGGSTNNTYSGPAGPNQSYAWQIAGDGSINGANNAQNVSVTAGASASFTLTLTVTDTQTGCSSVCAKTVTVNPLPSCSITGPNTVCSSSTGNTYTAPTGANL